MLGYLPTLHALFDLSKSNPAKAIELLEVSIPHELGVRADASTSTFRIAGNKPFTGLKLVWEKVIRPLKVETLID